MKAEKCIILAFVLFSTSLADEATKKEDATKHNTTTTILATTGFALKTTQTFEKNKFLSLLFATKNNEKLTKNTVKNNSIITTTNNIKKSTTINNKKEKNTLTTTNKNVLVNNNQIQTNYNEITTKTQIANNNTNKVLMFAKKQLKINKIATTNNQPRTTTNNKATTIPNNLRTINNFFSKIDELITVVFDLLGRQKRNVNTSLSTSFSTATIPNSSISSNINSSLMFNTSTFSGETFTLVTTLSSFFNVAINQTRNLFRIASFSTRIYKNLLSDNIISSCQNLNETELKLDLAVYYNLEAILFYSTCRIVIGNSTGGDCHLALYLGTNRYETLCESQNGWTKCLLLVYPIRVFTLKVIKKNPEIFKDNKVNLNLCEVYISGKFHPPDYNPHPGEVKKAHHTFEKGLAVGICFIGFCIFLFVKLKESELQERTKDRKSSFTIATMKVLETMKKEALDRQFRLKAFRRLERSKATALTNKRMQILRHEVEDNINRGAYF